MEVISSTVRVCPLKNRMIRGKIEDPGNGQVLMECLNDDADVGEEPRDTVFNYSLLNLRYRLGLAAS
jgi:hypothetical protein